MTPVRDGPEGRPFPLHVEAPDRGTGAIDFAILFEGVLPFHLSSVSPPAVDRAVVSRPAAALAPSSVLGVLDVRVR